MAIFFIGIVPYEANEAPPRFWLNQNLLEYVKFGALKLVSIVSPLSELGIVRRLFCWIPYSPRRFMLKIHNFSTI